MSMAIAMATNHTCLSTAFLFYYWLLQEVKCFECEKKAPSCDEECRRLIAEREEVGHTFCSYVFLYSPPPLSVQEERREEERRREEQERERQEEEAAFLRQIQPKRRRRRPRKVEEEEEEPTFYERHRGLVLAVGVAVGVATLAAVGYVIRS